MLVLVLALALVLALVLVLVLALVLALILVPVLVVLVLVLALVLVLVLVLVFVLVLTGTGDVLEPEDGLIGIGSGGNYALAAARALIDHKGFDAEAIARRAMEIAASICVHTNANVRPKNGCIQPFTA